MLISVGNAWRMIKMNKELIFPMLIILFNLGAAGVYLFSGEYRKALYFLTAAVLNITVL